MSSIKAKKGICVICEKQADISEKYLITDKCELHYKQFRASVNRDKKISKPKKFLAKTTIPVGAWFSLQIKLCPDNCEECGKSIVFERGQGGHWSSALIAHILAKRENMFPEIATHIENRMFFCHECHNKFDNRDNDYRSKMKSLPLLRKRLMMFYGELSESQRVRATRYLPFDFEELEKEIKISNEK